MVPHSPPALPATPMHTLIFGSVGCRRQVGAALEYVWTSRSEWPPEGPGLRTARFSPGAADGAATGEEGRTVCTVADSVESTQHHGCEL